MHIHPEKIGVIAGSGQFPLLFIKAAKEVGRIAAVVAHKGETLPEVAAAADVVCWVKLGQLGKIIRFFHEEGVGETVFLGAITKTQVFKDVFPDLKRFLPELIKGQSQTTARSEHRSLLLHQYAGDPLQGMNDLFTKIMTVDHNKVTTGLLQTFNREQQQGVIENGEKGFRTNEGVGQQTGSETGCQDHSLHQKKKAG